MPPIVDSLGYGGQSAFRTFIAEEPFGTRFEVSSAPDVGDVAPADARASLVLHDDDLTVSERATLVSAVLAVGF